MKKQSNQKQAEPVSVTISLRPDAYALLAGGAALHKLTPEEMLQHLVNDTSILADWSNEDYPMEVHAGRPGRILPAKPPTEEEKEQWLKRFNNDDRRKSDIHDAVKTARNYMLLNGLIRAGLKEHYYPRVAEDEVSDAICWWNFEMQEAALRLDQEYYRSTDAI